MLRSLARSVLRALPQRFRRRQSLGSLKSDPTIHEILSEIFQPFTSVSLPLISQVAELVEERYHGDSSRFIQEFLIPAKDVLLEFKQQTWLHLKYAPRDIGWPLCTQGKVITHLCPPNKDFLKEGDSYLCVKLQSPGKVTLTSQTLQNGELQETEIPRSDYKNVFNMDWIEKGVGSSSSDDQKRPQGGVNEDEDSIEGIKSLLRSIIVGGELGLQRNNWEEYTKPTLTERKTSRRFKLRRSKRKFKSRPNFEDFEESGVAKDLAANVEPIDGQDIGSSQPITKPEISGAAAKAGAAGTQCNSRNSATKQQIMDRLASQSPLTVIDCDFELLHSRAMVLSGSRDGWDAPILEISGDSHVWSEPVYSLQDLSNVLGYLHYIPREEVRNRGLSVVVDAREANKSAVEIITEALQVIEETRPGAIKHVYVLINKDSVFSRLTHSPVFKPKLNYKVDFVRSLDKLYNHIPASELTDTFDGSFVYDHENWLRFRMKLEPFMSGCRSAARFLLASIEDFTGGGASPDVPEGAEAIGMTMDKVQRKHRDIYQDKRLSGLHSEGSGILKQLEEEQGPYSQTEDYRDAIAFVSALFSQVHKACTRLDDMAEKRIAYLSQRLQFAAFEEESNKVTKWLSHEGQPRLEDIKERTADSLSGIIAIQKDFEKFYFKAMKYVGRGEDLLEDAHVLSEVDDEDSITIRELAKGLRFKLSTFTESLEVKRRYIEDAVRLYTMLDKAYEWALAGMKFVGVLGPEENSSRERCRLQLCTLEKYMREHPIIREEQFARMQELATNLNQDKCVQQSQFAQKRCEETQTILQKKMDQLRALLVSRRTNASSRSEHGHRSSRASLHDFDKSRLVRFDKDSDVADQNSGKSEFFRRTQSVNNDPKQQQHRDSLYSNGSVDSGISVGDKAPPTSPTEGVQNVTDTPKRRPVATIRPISELISSERRTQSLERLDEGYEENEQTECDERKSAFSPVRRRPHVSRTTRPHTTHLANRVDVPPSADDEFRVSDEEDTQETQWSPLDANRHIRRSICLEPGQRINIPVHPEAKNHPSYRKMILLMDEMIQTEQDYVLSLKYIISNYYPEMDREDIPQGLRGQRSAVFGNLEKIYEFHERYFLQELKRCQSAPLQVCHSFLKHKKEFGLYALYNKNKPRSDSLLADYGSFFRGKQKNLSDNMDVASYLLKPVQRLGKYALLIRDLIRECRSTDPELALLKASQEMVQFQMRHGNDLLAMDSLRECDVNLFEQGELLRQDEFLVYRGHRKCLRHVFLFEDLILFSKTRRTARGHDVYQYKFSLKMTDIGMTENIGESGLKFMIWFRRRKTNDKAYTLHCKNQQVKREWTTHVSKLLWQQAFKSKEARQAEHSSMGVGSKPCIDIKPSRDRINDRAINLAGRAPKDRNSIAVSSLTADQLMRSSYSTSPRPPRPLSSSSLTQRALLPTNHLRHSIVEAVEEGEDPVPIKATDDSHLHARRRSVNKLGRDGRALSDGSLNSSDEEKTKEEKRSSQYVTAVSVTV